MAIKQAIYDVDVLWDMYCRGDFADKRYELIDGVLIEVPRPNLQHGWLAAQFARYLLNYAEAHALGIVTVESGYHSNDPYTLLGPDVAFVSYSRLPAAESGRWAPVMPDLAVEVKLPSESMGSLRDKARIYLQNGSRLVWLALPAQERVEVCRWQEGIGLYSETVDKTGTLKGEVVLPGFSLPLSQLFS